MNLDQFLQGYCHAALWAGLDWTNVESEENPDGEDNPVPLDDNYSIDDIAPDTLAAMREDCEGFINANREALEAYVDILAIEYEPFTGRRNQAWNSAGGDYFLSRNGHGAGFFDRGFEAVFQRLQEAAKSAGSCELYPGDDGLLYLE